MITIDLIAVAFVALIVGIVIGVLLGRQLSPQEQKSRELEQRLQQSEEQLSSYQQEVTEHFAHTAKLVNNLTQSYKEVHEHLATDSLRLANVDISRQLASHSPSEDSQSFLEDETIEPPKDWAPKTPGLEGLLSEGYGLADEEKNTGEVLASAKP